MRIAEAVRDCAVFIGYQTESGFFAAGTGFVLSVNHKGVQFGYVATALHVIRSFKSHDFVFLRINTADGASCIVKTSYDDWYHHPADQEIDAAVYPISLGPVPTREIKLTQISEEYFLTGAQTSILNPEAGEPAVTIGLFANHQGVDRNIPIVRVGNIAALAKDVGRIQTSWGVQRAHLVEVRSIGGLSGSPVFVQVAPMRIINGKIASSQGLKSYYLMGLMQGHINMKYERDIIRAPGESAPSLIREEYSPDELNSGIAVVVPIEQLLEIINQPNLVFLREIFAEAHHEATLNAQIREMRRDADNIDFAEPELEGRVRIDDA